MQYKMKSVIVTGSHGLIGSECVEFFHDLHFKVIGVDDDSRKKFFGLEASTELVGNKLKKLKNYEHYDVNIKNIKKLSKIFKKSSNTELIIHTAAQPSHDWAATDPFEDFNTNALGTLNVLELTKKYSPESVFILTSTNKVYGDTPNKFSYKELETRYNPSDDLLANNGFDESLTIDNSKHSLFGVSKTYADLITQEYGKYFGLRTGVFRGGCLTGSNHSGVSFHGFLSYLIRCAIAGKKYYINGYKGKQIRDNIHSKDVVSAFYEFYKNPKCGEVYNIGGGSYSNCSIIEAISCIKQLSGISLSYEIIDKNRDGDHIWYVSNMNKFKKDYPNWQQKYNIESIITEMLGNKDIVK